MKRTFALVVGLTLSFFAVSSFVSVNTVEAATAKKMKIGKFTGQIQIKLADGSIIGVVPGAAVPDIPAGAEIVVVSGTAEFTVGGTKVTASAGDSFSYSAPSGGGASIAATGSTSNIEVAVGGTKATLSSGDAVTAPTTAGAGSLKVTAGNVPVQTGSAPAVPMTSASAPVEVVAVEAAAPTTTTQTKTTVVQVDADATQTQIDAIIEAVGLDAATVTVVTVENASQNETIEDLEGIATDVSPSAP